MADISSKLINLSAEKLLALHDRVHKSAAPTAAEIEVHHTILNEMARRKMVRPQDSWDEYEILVDSIQDVDLTSLKASLPEGMAEDVIKTTGSTVGNLDTYLTIDGYEMRIEPIELDPMEKMIREEGGKYTVYDSTGKRKFGTYGSKKEAEARLEQMHRFSKADNTPPKAVRDAARRALDWIAEGKAGSGFTAVGRGRASQLASGENISIETLKRMKSFFSRHEVDKNAVGFSQGEKGFPSAGRVAWDAWGGDAGFAWAEAMVDKFDNMEKHLSGQHDQKTHAPAWTRAIVDGIKAGDHPTVEPENLSALMKGMAKLTEHPDITELKIKGHLLYGDEGMGIARKDMPQIPGSARPEFLKDLGKEGVSVESESVDPRTLKPIQKEISGSRSGAKYNSFAEGGKVPDSERILISKDGYVVDGHHTWAASVALAFDNGSKIPVYRIGLNAKEALSASLDWSKAKGYEGQAIDAPEAKKSFIWKHLEGQHDQKSHGGWSAGSSSYADDVAPTKERSAKAVSLASAIRDRAVKVEPQVTELVDTFAKNAGGKLVGLRQRLKSTDSLARKIDADAAKEHEGNHEKAAESVSDAIRYTIKVPDANYADGLDATVKGLEGTGWQVRTKNFWQSGDPYDGVNIKATKNGVAVEIQLHTQKSLDVKDGKLHGIYEKYRVSTDNTFRRQSWDKMVEIAKSIPRPANMPKLLAIGSLVVQQFETAEQAGLTKSTPVDIIQDKRGGE